MSQEDLNRKFAEDIATIKAGLEETRIQQAKHAQDIALQDDTLSDLGHEIKMMRWAMYIIAGAVFSNSPMFAKLVEKLTEVM